MASRLPDGTLIKGKRPALSSSQKREEEDAYDEQMIQFERFGNYTQRIQGPPPDSGIRPVVAIERLRPMVPIRERLARDCPRQYRLESNGDLVRISFRSK